MEKAGEYCIVRDLVVMLISRNGSELAEKYIAEEYFKMEEEIMKALAEKV